MKMTFFGLQGSFGFRQIGGTDSYFRRISVALAKAGHDISFVHYRCERDCLEQPAPGITLREFRALDDALHCLAAHKGTVVVNTLRKWDRLTFMRFRRRQKREIRFYLVASGYYESCVKRTLRLLDATLYPYNGGALCMSPRLLRALRLHRNRAFLLLPPVPGHYYVRPEDKPDGDRLIVTCIGRTISGKGVDEAIEVFKRLRHEPGIETRMCGYVWPDRDVDNSIHKWLIGQSDIKYSYEQYKGWSPAVDEKVANILRETDILLLPYRNLQSTIDVPLVLLEGMAASCCVITKSLGDIPAIYGKGPFLLPPENFAARAAELITQIKNHRQILQEERRRVRHRTEELRFDQETITARLLGVLQ